MFHFDLVSPFSLGNVSVFPGAQAVLEADDISPESLLVRHACGDWGERVSKGDAAVNRMHAQGGGSILSAYLLASGAEVWVITSWDHAHTEVLLPEEHPEV